jgi:hypothetical protein
MSTETKDLTNIYERFFKHNGCTSLLTILNKFSRIDGVLQSGDTTIVLEYKHRTGSVSDFQSCILEKKKWLCLRDTSILFGNAPAFYVVEYDELILIYQIDFAKPIKAEQLPAPASTVGDKSTVTKYVFFLKYEDADIVISKKTWEKATRDQLMRYLEMKRNEE